MWILLTVHLSQTELTVNTHVTVVNTHTLVADVHHGVASTHSVISELRHDVTNTHTIVSDIRRDMLKREEGTDDKNRTVSDTHVLYVAEQTLTAAQAQNRSAIWTTNRPASYLFI